MTPKQIGLIGVTWDKILPIADTAAELFYGKLFELDPSLKPLFKGDLKEQGKKLMTMLDTVVKSLEHLEVIIPAAQASGARHVGYGVKDKDYDTVASALLWTLGQGLGDDFTDDVKEAWTTAYIVLSTVMKEAAKKAAA
ncbi:MAG: globin domain-containing protein [Gammaproteobacteria bacterium]|nr:globin domain-containing protein [Gammaproteobacteria bacterium]MCW8988784.1 globin domain-containing protein [Gammaproteobacteria bacterium]